MPIYTVEPTDRIRQHSELSAETIERLMGDDMTFTFPEWCDELLELGHADYETIVKLLYVTDLAASFDDPLPVDMTVVSVETFDQYWKVVEVPVPYSVTNTLAALDSDEISTFLNACPEHLVELANKLVDKSAEERDG